MPVDLGYSLYETPAPVPREGVREKRILINLARIQLLVNLVRTENALTVVVSLSELR
ncbi:hypothetical protein [Cellvibrio sp. UBA7661]|uniref:hypothetical protein n=1 Tax=Cellvibrio sp. UBA7661 TaxID=1946311 RepID=UPI002F35521C